MKILKKGFSFLVCLVFAVMLSIPAFAINMPNNSKLLGYYNSSTYQYVLVQVEKTDFVLIGIWAKDVKKYIGGVAEEGYMSKDNFIATVYSYSVKDINTNNTIATYNGEANVQRTVSQKFGLFNKLKSTTINNDTGCSTNNSVTQTY